jgi:hypothetical protein
MSEGGVMGDVQVGSDPQLCYCPAGTSASVWPRARDVWEMGDRHLCLRAACACTPHTLYLLTWP